MIYLKRTFPSVGQRLQRAWEGDQSPVLTVPTCGIYGKMKQGCGA